MSLNSEYRAKHDLGGRESEDFQPATHELTDLDQRVDALVNLLAFGTTPVVKPDERRLGIEELSEADYFHLSYYERWLHGVVNILLKKGILTKQELFERIEHLKGND